MNNPQDALTAPNFQSAEQEAVGLVPPSRYSGPESAYKLAFADTDFLLRKELRQIRMQLELLKPEMTLQEHGIESTIVLFGSARIPAPEDAAAHLAAAQAGGDPLLVRQAEMQVSMATYYEEARRFAGLVTAASQKLDAPIYVVTGGGPGIMEAGNRGAHEVGGKSIGLNILLPHEQDPNPYITPELCFQFHYFGLRKMHFLMRSVALACFPGGFGTLDELFETLTLIQTGKSRRRPILLFGTDFWRRLINFELLVDTGMISPQDINLFHFVETAEEGWGLLQREYGLGMPPSQTGQFAVDV